LPQVRLTSSFLRICAGLAVAATVSGCGTGRYLSYPPQVRGHQVDAERLAELVPGISTQADVTALLGTPTTKATFDDNTWLYLSEVTRPRIASVQTVLEQQVVAVTFDAKGVLRGVETRTDADSHPVSVVARTTPSPGTEASFLQQLFGNIGRFGPGLGGSSSSSSNY
jgi:outer membrane protein assembly factor BamE (lipoprotein component of BamABCDE complex)